jgi:ferredoxin-NADP reductase
MKLRFLKADQEVEGVMTFWFRPPEPLSWQAGQSIRLEVPVGYDSEERRFTISSAPYEADIAVTTNLSRSRFKQALMRLQPGDSIDGYSIEGDMIWPLSDSRPLIFCASGIGITPFIALLKQRRHERKPLTVTLFYSSRQVFVYADFLRQLAKRHPQLRLILLTEPLSLAAVLQHLPAVSRPLVYLAGKPNQIEPLAEHIRQHPAWQAEVMTDIFTD